MSSIELAQKKRKGPDNGSGSLHSRKSTGGSLQSKKEFQSFDIYLQGLHEFLDVHELH